MFYSFLTSKGVMADSLFNNETHHILVSIAKKSLNSMKMYITYITNCIDSYFQRMASEPSLRHIIHWRKQ